MLGWINGTIPAALYKESFLPLVNKIKAPAMEHAGAA
jgi:hypothetical protein